MEKKRGRKKKREEKEKREEERGRSIDPKNLKSIFECNSKHRSNYFADIILFPFFFN